MKLPGNLNAFARVASLNSINILALALGFLQQLAVVKCHGTTAVTDFYFLLMVVPQVTINLATSITTNALLPFLVRRRERMGEVGEAALIGYFESKLQRTGWFLALGALAVGTVQATLAPAWNTAKLDLVLMVFCAPFFLAYGAANSLFTTALQSKRQYWPTLTAMLFAPTFGLICGLALPSLGAWPFVAGQAVGMLAQFLWLKKRLTSSLGRPGVTDSILSDDEKSEVRQKVKTLLSIGIGFQFLPFIERTVAQRAGTGSVAAIALGSRLGSCVTPVLLSATAMILFTTFAELAAAGNAKEAAARLLQVLSLLQWLFTALIFLGPLILGKLLPLVLQQPGLLDAVGHVFPDYLLAGCVGATGAIAIACYYSVFHDYRFQLYAIYGSLAVYATILSLPLWTPVAFSLRLISFANATYCALSASGITLYVALSIGRAFPWHYLASLLTLLSAWLFVRGHY